MTALALTENVYLTLPAREPEPTDITVTISDLYRYDGEVYVLATIGFAPASGGRIAGVMYHADGAGLVSILRALGRPATIWFINGCRVDTLLAVPGMAALLEAGR